MCATCGCGDDSGVRITAVGMAGEHHDRRARPGGHPHDGHPHDDHSHDDHSHDDHSHDDHLRPDGKVISLEQRVLAKNDQLAAANRSWLAERGVAVLNLMSAPGSGKTTLLVRTIDDVGAEFGLTVIEGDQETLLDGERIRATGCSVVQINTGAGCHLDADMMARGLHELGPPPRSLVIVENVGNLVCPALFDLGESYRVVICSVTEGADKPLKYPQMFRGADLVLLNKADLLPYLDVELDQFVTNVELVNPAAKLLTISATRGDGLNAWYEQLRELIPADLNAN